MFEKVGKKIKAVVVLVFGLETLASLIFGFIIMSEGEKYSVLIGLSIVIGGPIVAWISSWLLYGYGEIIDKLTDIERNTRNGVNDEETKHIDPERKAVLDDLLKQGLITKEEYEQALYK